MVDEEHEVPPKRPRKRSRTFAKRVEFRLTGEQLDTANEARELASVAQGREVTLASVLRASLMDGCEQMIASLQRAQNGGGAVDSAALDRVLAELQQVRTEVRRVGHNVNQIAAVANASGQVPDGLVGVQQELAALSGQLVRCGASLLDLSESAEG